MYKWFAIKRILKGVVIYAITIFLLSALFNTVSETTQRSQIEEQIRLEQTRLKNLLPAQIKAFQAERRANLIRQYKLDRPIVERIIFRTASILTFNFGKSMTITSSKGERDVAKIISETIPRSLILFVVAAAIEIAFGIFLGLKQAQKPGGKLDRTTSVVTMVVYGMPVWWLAMIIIMFFVYTLKLFPSGGIHSVPMPTGFMYFVDMVWHIILPLFTLLVLGFWGTAFVTRNIVLGILQEDYIMAARARGIPERKVLFGHTLRTAAPPLMTMAILGLLGSIGGAIVFEGIFSWPGLGNLYWIAVQQNDIPVLLADLAVTIGLYQVGLISLDLLYGFLDPRIKVGGKS
ncbi:MAG: ABC transporter permease [Rectinemataceae bacterium]